MSFLPSVTNSSSSSSVKLSELSSRSMSMFFGRCPFVADRLFPDVSFSSFLRKSCRQCRCRCCRRCPRRRRCRRCCRRRRWRQSCTRVCRKCFALQPTLNDSKQTSPSRKKKLFKKRWKKKKKKYFNRWCFEKQQKPGMHPGKILLLGVFRSRQHPGPRVGGGG